MSARNWRALLSRSLNLGGQSVLDTNQGQRLLTQQFLRLVKLAACGEIVHVFKVGSRRIPKKTRAAFDLPRQLLLEAGSLSMLARTTMTVKARLNGFPAAIRPRQC
jgi:hypothetical protein